MIMGLWLRLEKDSLSCRDTSCRILGWNDKTFGTGPLHDFFGPRHFCLPGPHPTIINFWNPKNVIVFGCEKKLKYFIQSCFLLILKEIKYFHRLLKAFWVLALCLLCLWDESTLIWDLLQNDPVVERQRGKMDIGECGWNKVDHELIMLKLCDGYGGLSYHLSTFMYVWKFP